MRIYLSPAPFDLGNSGFLVLPFTTVSLQLLVLTSDNFTNGGIVLSRHLRIFLLPPPGFELGTSGFLVLHSTTVPW